MAETVAPEDETPVPETADSVPEDDSESALSRGVSDDGVDLEDESAAVQSALESALDQTVDITDQVAPVRDERQGDTAVVTAEADTPANEIDEQAITATDSTQAENAELADHTAAVEDAQERVSSGDTSAADAVADGIGDQPVESTTAAESTPSSLDEHAQTADVSDALEAESELTGSEAEVARVTGWRGVAGRLIGRAKRVLTGAEDTTAAPSKPRVRRKSTGESGGTVKRKRSANPSGAPRAKRAAPAPTRKGLWGRLLDGVGLGAPDAPDSPKPKRARKATTARSAPRKPRAKRTAKAAPSGLFARTLARFGFGVDEPHESDTTTPKKRRAASRKTNPGADDTVKKPAKKRRAKPKTLDQGSVWRRALRRVLGRD